MVRKMNTPFCQGKVKFGPCTRTGPLKFKNCDCLDSFYHQIPAFQLPDERSGSLRGFLELGPFCTILPSFCQHFILCPSDVDMQLGGLANAN